MPLVIVAEVVWGGGGGGGERLRVWGGARDVVRGGWMRKRSFLLPFSNLGSVAPVRSRVVVGEGD